jgi:hypothetical protein
MVKCEIILTLQILEKKMKSVLLAGLLTLTLGGCGAGNLDDVKVHAEETFESVGFKVVGYEGYQWGFWGFNNYGGAKVWYRLDKIPWNGITYSGYIQKWGDEYHVYGPIATDAIKP